MKVKTKERIKLIIAIVIFIVLFGIVGTWDMECRKIQLGEEIKKWKSHYMI